MKLLPCIFLILLALKLAGIGAVATWSWWLVTMPLWIGIAIAAGLFVFAAVLGGSLSALAAFLPRKRRR
ncbi:transmembrane Fragile-X-F family protein [Burkholderia cepacia]|uniref:transmembrane Fragile-X-F family protein n=1 Tax=Burkholderia cepacia TaxID=292 RepID=UPI000F56910E|nr:transmembrane Fragile-X-F family protein [Burkholderia cepacia]RQT68101.1 transmembrane Fragile-X-F family protein [Burkholderia cepacia]